MPPKAATPSPAAKPAAATPSPAAAKPAVAAGPVNPMLAFLTRKEKTGGLTPQQKAQLEALRKV